jgi:hypothetical protein
VFRDLNPTKSGQVRGWLTKAGSLGRVGGSELSGRGSELAGRGSVGRSGIGSRLIPCRPSKGSGLSRAGWLAGLVGLLN